jgi:hypothetical protein
MELLNMQLYQQLRERKKEIIEKLVLYIKTNHSSRTDDYYKCTRDLEYIYSAIADDLVNENTDSVRRISSKFWHKGTRQLISYDVEFKIYDLLEQELLKIVEFSHHSLLRLLINKLKNIIEHGPDLSYLEQKMQDRRNVVKFKKNATVPQELESIIDNCIENTPVQNHTNFCFLKANIHDQEIKDFLVKNFFYNDTFNRHMIAISTAPLVYILVYSNSFTSDSEKIVDNDHLQVGIHSGAIMQETLNFGYDFAFIGCGPDTTLVSDKTLAKWANIMHKRWGVVANNSRPRQFPMLCLCIGKGEFDAIAEDSQYTLDSGVTVNSQIFDPIERKHRPKKLFT